MKRFISGVVAGILISSTIAFAATYTAHKAGFKVLVNGKEFTSDPPPLVVEGRTYLPLRAMGDALGVPVEWNAELQQAEVGTTPVVDEEKIEISYYKEYSTVPDFGKIFNVEEVSGIPLMGSDWRVYKYLETSGRNGNLTKYVDILKSEGFEFSTASSEEELIYMKNKTAVILSADDTYFEIMIMER